MVIDSSAIVAIFFDEPERADLLQRLNGAQTRLLSAGSHLEAGIVLSLKKGSGAVLNFELFLSSFAIQVVAFDKEQAIMAREAYERYGKGRHKAYLNMGDCMTYALAKQTGQPLLFKGNDFIHTDLTAA